MGASACSLLSEGLFGKTRRTVLALLYGRPDEAFYLRQIARLTAAGQGAVQREVAHLAEHGIIRRSVRGNQVCYQAEPGCPIFKELKSIVTKTAGAAGVLRESLAPLAPRIVAAFIYGSLAQGRERPRSDIDVMVIGAATFAEVSRALRSAEERLAREVNPAVYPRREFRSKVAAGHHFLTTVLREPKIFLFGEADDLAGLAQE